MTGIFSRVYSRWLTLTVALVLALGIGPLALLSPARGHAAQAAQAARTSSAARANSALARPAVAKPNVLLITADDMRFDDLKFMPFTQDVLRRRGVTFSDAVSPYPLCCPARAQILTGQYNHNNGVMGNAWPYGGFWALKDQHNTLPVWLAQRGYHTAFIGRYLNQYGNPPAGVQVSRHRRKAAPPGWEDWYGSVDGVFAYTNVTVNEDHPSTRPHRRFVGRYQTDFFGDRTAGLIRRYHRSGGPFFIWASHLAPHSSSTGGGWHPPVPAKRDRGLYASMSLPNDRTYRLALNAPPKGKFGLMANLQRQRLRPLRRWHTKRAESLASLDRAVEQAVTALRRTHEYRRTVIIFTSDNGFALGEHRYFGKDRPYEPELHVPMIVNAPGIKRRYTTGRPKRRLTVPDTVTMTDIAATIVGVTGARPGRPLDGIDMTRPVQNPDHRPGGDRAVLIESGPVRGAAIGTEKFVGVRTNRYTWLAWKWEGVPSDVHGRGELYNRRTDPAQLHNLANPVTPTPTQTALSDLALQMRGCLGAACVQSAP